MPARPNAARKRQEDAPEANCKRSRRGRESVRVAKTVEVRPLVQVLDLVVVKDDNRRQHFKGCESHIKVYAGPEASQAEDFHTSWRLPEESGKPKTRL